MKRATFRQLRAFDAIVRHGSFSRAAEEMHLTQPTLSMQVKKISNAVGLPLFEQIGKKIYLTDAGRVVHELCQDVFASVARFEMGVADLKGLKTGGLRLAAVTTAEFFLLRLLGPFCNRHPGVDVSLEILNRERMLERLRANADDIYVFGQPPLDFDIEAIRFLENPLVVIGPKGHRLAGARNVPLAQLLGEPLLMREHGSGTRTAIEQFFAETAARPKVKMELGSNEAIKQAIIGGLGVSILSRHTIEDTAGLVEIDVEGFPLVRHWYVVRPAGKKMSVVARAFCGYLAETCAAELSAWA
ncbi:MAG: LysR family transcriptional regulator [Rhodospirillales bacterium]|nr:LysR family transcriptional regulator [Rhodospirillales bacterium]